MYSFATRGHRNEIWLDPVKHELRIAALNRRDENRNVTRVPLAKVKSLYVKRPKTRGEPASLQIRMRDSAAEICALRGDEEEMETFHRFLCRDIRMTRPF